MKKLLIGIYFILCLTNVNAQDNFKGEFDDFRNETKKEFETAFDSLPTTLKNVKIFDCSVGDGDMIYYFACDHIIGHAHEIASFYPSYLEHGITPNFA